MRSESLQPQHLRRLLLRDPGRDCQLGLDAGTYTTFVELNGGNGAATILIKAFMSAGEFVLPLLIAQLTANGLWFGWSFMTMAALVVINFVLILPLSFPCLTKVRPKKAAEKKG
ncbi:hypothetical protein QPX96_02585 [Limosilactobacillus fermentum]|nr:hypothetical protein [Limosilactobacillus fermentum]